MLDKLIAAKELVLRHKSALAVAAVTIPVIVVQHKGIADLNEFLDSNNLLEKFYDHAEV